MIYDSPAQAKTILIIDVSNLGWRAYYANSNLKTCKATPSGHIHGSANIVQAILRDFGESVCAIWAYDGPGAKEERQKILPEYKANREKRDFDPIQDMKELCGFFPGLHIEQEGREGDDAIAYACKLCSNKDIIIYSGDRDLVALMENPNVRVYSPNKSRFVESSDIYADYHVFEPAKIPLAKSLMGDPSDNIKGVPRIPKKQLEPILNDPKCVDIDGFYDIIRNKPTSMSDTMWKRSLELEDKIKTNYQVILPNITNFSKKSVQRTYKTQENRMKLIEFLNNFECYAVLDRIGAIYE